MEKEITFKCRACGLPIENNDGALCLRASEVNAAQDNKARAAELTSLEGSKSLGDLVLAEKISPSEAEWRAFHNNCVDMNEAASFYHIPLNELQTHKDLNAWTAHLLEKKWILSTNWRKVLRGQVDKYDA